MVVVLLIRLMAMILIEPVLFPSLFADQNDYPAFGGLANVLDGAVDLVDRRGSPAVQPVFSHWHSTYLTSLSLSLWHNS